MSRDPKKIAVELREATKAEEKFKRESVDAYEHCRYLEDEAAEEKERAARLRQQLLDAVDPPGESSTSPSPGDQKDPPPRVHDYGCICLDGQLKSKNYARRCPIHGTPE